MTENQDMNLHYQCQNIHSGLVEGDNCSGERYCPRFVWQGRILFHDKIKLWHGGGEVDMTWVMMLRALRHDLMSQYGRGHVHHHQGRCSLQLQRCSLPPSLALIYEVRQVFNNELSVSPYFAFRLPPKKEITIHPDHGKNSWFFLQDQIFLIVSWTKETKRQIISM